VLPQAIIEIVLDAETISILAKNSKKNEYKTISVPYDGEIELFHNQGVVVKGTAIMARYDSTTRSLVTLLDHEEAGSDPKDNKEMRLYFDHIRNQNNFLVIAVGTAGVGKTSNAMRLGLGAVMAPKSMYDALVVIKPIIEVGGKLGFLPGDVDQKTDPYMESYADAIKTVTQESLEDLEHKKKLEIMISQYARGRDIQNRIIIIDEAQNFTNAELGTLLSRFHDSCKVIVCGDLRQCDVRGMTLRDNGLYNLILDEFGNHQVGYVELKKNLRGKLSQMGVRLASKGTCNLLGDQV
jgi:predicted ribonuclease YlaK